MSQRACTGSAERQSQEEVSLPAPLLLRLPSEQEDGARSRGATSLLSFPMLSLSLARRHPLLGPSPSVSSPALALLLSSPRLSRGVPPEPKM